jgi:hypothetical protein
LASRFESATGKNMAICRKLKKPQAWLKTYTKTQNPMATYDHVLQTPTVAELEVRYWNLVSACDLRSSQLEELRANRDSARKEWLNAGGHLA